MADYPYMVSNNKIPQIIEKIITAAKPQKFTQEILKNLGFVSSNDRAFIPLMKKLGFLSDDGTPTHYYDQLREPSKTKTVLADRIRSLYADLFAINTSIYSAPEQDIKGAISRVTGKDENGVNRIYATFKTLCANADFSGTSTVREKEKSPKAADPTPSFNLPDKPALTSSNAKEFHYNIQIHLPATTDISVYNAIFKSLKENLIL